MTSNIIKFIHSDRVIEIHDPNPNETLLNYVRTKLRKTGTKEGCAEGGCGACTIVLGELKNNNIIYKAINSCISLVPSLEGKQLILVEDLVKKNGTLHPVQDAMIKYHGSQCGFCTPGFLITSQALLTKNPSPSDNEIACAIEGNLCRCTGYQQIIQSIQAAAAIHRGDESPSKPASYAHSDPHPSGPD